MSHFLYTRCIQAEFSYIKNPLTRLAHFEVIEKHFDEVIKLEQRSYLLPGGFKNVDWVGCKIICTLH